MKYFFFLIALFYFDKPNEDFFQKLSDAAIALTEQKVQYDPSYFVIAYPNGDLPADKGVCADVIIRAYRSMGIDLQKEVHEDMNRNFSAYPQRWGLHHADPNIDHRRVPNLMRFFERKKSSLPVTHHADDYHPGDIVCWMINGKLTHTGIMVNRRTADKQRWMVVHNIGAGQVMEDCLFAFPIIGHYRYNGGR